MNHEKETCPHCPMRRHAPAALRMLRGLKTYKKNYVYLNAYTMYVVEDITGTHTDPYHYRLYFHVEPPLYVETKP